MPSNCTSERYRSRRGGSLVEFAIVVPAMFLLLAGAVQFGEATYLYARLVEGVARGARYASRATFDEPGHTFAAKVANVVVCGTPAACAGQGLVGISAANVSVTWTKDTHGVPQTLTVKITNFSRSILMRTFSWNGKPAVTTQFCGVFKS
jgi:Flp pilus assembly protein TadG